jgi:hypothetical protein
LSGLTFSDTLVEEKPPWSPLGECFVHAQATELPRPQIENLMQSPLHSSPLHVLHSPVAEDESLMQQMNEPGQPFEPVPYTPFDIRECPSPEPPPKVVSWLSSKLDSMQLNTFWEESESETETEPEEPLVDPLEDVGPCTLLGTAQLLALGVASADDVDTLAERVYLKAVSDPVVTPGLCSDLLVLLLPQLPPLVEHRREGTAGSSTLLLLSSVVQRCNADLGGVETESPSANSHGSVLFLGELLKRNLVGLGEVKALFQKLLFVEPVLDHAASLACHLFLSVGPVLDRQPVGQKLVDLVQMRLKELKGGNYSHPTRFSLGHVTDLRTNRWMPKPEETPKKPGKSSKLCLPKVCASPPADASEREEYSDNVRLIGSLFVESRVQMPVVKALFQKLLFVKTQPLDADVSLAVELLRTVGPVLDQSEVGSTLADYVLLRFQELKENSFADTLKAVTEVTKLRSSGWSTERSFTFKVGCSP